MLNRLSLHQAVFAALAILVTPAGQSQTFETASIKPNRDSNGYGRIQGFPGGRWTATGVSIRRLVSYSNVLFCCPTPSWRLTSAKGLDQILDESYDIEAKAEPGAIQGKNYNDQMRPMVRALLADRFQLVIRHETKEGPVFALVTAKNGPKFKPSKIDCDNAQGGAGKTCHTMSFRPGTDWKLSADALGMAELVELLQGYTDRPVIDKTGLRGLFEIAVEVSRPESPFDAMRSMVESLGLKLEPQKGPVESLVIDQVARPSEN